MSADANRWRRVLAAAERSGVCAACGGQRALRQLRPGVFAVSLVHDAGCPAETWRRSAVPAAHAPAGDRTAG